MIRPLRVVVCGSRDWSDRETIRAWLARLPPGSEVAHGDCGREETGDDGETRTIGADWIAAEEALRLGFTVRSYPADWSTYDKAAGPKRNRAMLDAERPELVLAFTDSLVVMRRGRRELSGTGDCVAAANERRIRATVIPSGSRP